MAHDKIDQYLREAHAMMEQHPFDKKNFEKIEDFALKNGARYADNLQFAELSMLLSELADKNHLTNLAAQQKRFGLNSRAS